MEREMKGGRERRREGGRRKREEGRKEMAVCNHLLLFFIVSVYKIDLPPVCALFDSCYLLSPEY